MNKTKEEIMIFEKCNFLVIYFFLFLILALSFPNPVKSEVNFGSLCLGCHQSSVLHDQIGHEDCSQCHNGQPELKNITSKKCIVCHPTGDAGMCSLLNYHDPDFGATCLECHAECEDPITTTTTAIQTFNISGTVTGAVSADVPINLTGLASQTVTTDASGNYQFTGLASGYYIITPELERYKFNPENREIPNLTGDISGIDFTSKRACCAAKKIYGEDSDEVNLLRDIRDTVLHKTPEGRELTKLYYQWSPVIVRAMEEDEEFEQEVKEIIDGVLELIEGEAE